MALEKIKHRIFLCFFVIAFCFIQAHAITAKQAYQKAVEYDKNGDIKRANEYYKLAIDLAIPNFRQVPSFAKEQVKEYDKAQKAYQEYLHFEDNQTKESVGQIITGVFGLQPYHTNYLLPIVYDRASYENIEHYETQFQISFKKTMFSNLFGLNESYNFAYSQTSWWQTFKKSSPFRETNYRPEIFVSGFYGDKNSLFKGYQLGLLHESNGQDYNRSRSWNRVYLMTGWQIGKVFVAPRIWYRLKEGKKKNPSDDGGDDNPDIQDYLGYGDLNIFYPYKKHILKLKIGNNLKFNNKNRGSFGLEWTFPLWSDNFFGILRYFTGYGKSLETYKTHANTIGIGFALSR